MVCLVCFHEKRPSVQGTESRGATLLRFAAGSAIIGGILRTAVKPLRSDNGEPPGRHRAVSCRCIRPFRRRLRDPFRQVHAPVRSTHRLSAALPQAYSFSSSPFHFFANYTPANEKVNLEPYAIFSDIQFEKMPGKRFRFIFSDIQSVIQ